MLEINFTFSMEVRFLRRNFHDFSCKISIDVFCAGKLHVPRFVLHEYYHKATSVDLKLDSNSSCYQNRLWNR